MENRLEMENGIGIVMVVVVTTSVSGDSEIVS
jgi:hypothetical protein